ncbi:GTP-binding protein [Clostridium sp. SYSU_GA19001]|uniref:CobW family GTP-binding protein n=1 Tax=Clostridium caldaquaticum TaxID=2940653 RepID=UPI0020779B3E|nr:GTP-binding protein [Clostridium caldaquaticum]MCM8711364.1 GTP-binding protein [Clostridium caldaquaticum]
MKVKVDIFSGFLGAGKTTLIKKLISEDLYKEKVIVIENEFGEAGIDGSILKKTNIEVKEVNAGCICCSISGDFKRALKEAAYKYNPDRIIIEPSGVAKLSEVMAACSSLELRSFLELNMIITVADVLKFEIYSRNFGEFYKNQIINAKTIVLSRTQNASIDKISQIKDYIYNLNAKAVVVTTPWDKLSSKRIIELAQSAEKMKLQEEVNLIRKPIGSTNLKTLKAHRGDEIFQTIGWETPKKFQYKALQDKLNKINDCREYGDVLRAKGIVEIENNEWIQFDYVPGEFEARKTTPDYSGRICVIGVNLNKQNLNKLFGL